MRNAYIRALTELTREDPRVYSLVADNGAIVFDDYRADFSERFINYGIAEANMVSGAAGMASCGLIPFAYTIASFITQRAFEQIRNDVCLQRMNVKLVGVGAGFVYSALGPTHHGTEDIAVMRALPGMTVLSPADPDETFRATRAAAEIDGPVYMRIASTREPAVYDGPAEFIPGKGVVMRDGGDVTVIATGVVVHDALEAARRLDEQGVSARVVNMHTLAPLDEKIVAQAAEETGAIVTVEEHSLIGGLGSAVAEALAVRVDAPTLFRPLGLRGFCGEYGSHDDLKAQCGIDADAIVAECVALCERK